MHIQQTKVQSRATGRPQYYLHNAPAHIKDFLRKRGACPVLLQTPYGIARSTFVAVGRDHKLENGEVVRGKVGHDRIQGEESIGESVRYWYGLQPGKDFERIDLEGAIHADEEGQSHFILAPTAFKFRNRTRPLIFEKDTAPLSFHRHIQSQLWKHQIAARREEAKEDVLWAAAQMGRVVQEHQLGKPNVSEADLLRTAGALSLLGMDLSLYLTKGYDCLESKFHFTGYPIYCRPVEIKKRSLGFKYQILNYAKLPRAVILCIEHDLPNPPAHVDIVELSALVEYFRN